MQDVLDGGLDPAVEPPHRIRGARAVTAATLVFSAMELPLLAIHAATAGPGMAAAGAATVTAALANLVWLRRTGRVTAAGHVATGIAFLHLLRVELHTGGLATSAFPWLTIVPLVAALLVGLRAAALWSIASAAATAVILSGSLASFLPADPQLVAPGSAFLWVDHLSAIACVGLLAGLLAHAYGNADASLRHANQELQRDGRYLRLLHQAAMLANDADTMEEALERSVELLYGDMGWDVANVWLLSPEAEDRLAASPIGRLPASSPYAAFQSRTCAEPIPRGRSLPGRVLASRAPVSANDVGGDARFAHAEAAREVGLRGALAFPILLADEVIAVLELFRAAPYRSERRLLRLLSHLGTQVGRVVERRRAEARIESLAYYDDLTGLPNRQLFQQRLHEALAQARTAGGLAALLFVDLDGFKRVNDTLGHSVGDGLLREVTRRFAQSIRLNDVLGRGEQGRQAISRLGGDEFTVLLGKVADRAGASVVADRLLAALAEPVVVDGHEIFAGASIGIAMFPDDGNDPESLLRNADAAMYLAKSRGRGQFQFYADERTEAGSRRLRLEGPLRRALESDQFELHYQPLLDMRTRETVGAEALLRWNAPEIGNVSPAEFIPLAEQCGLINPIGDWIIRSACAQIRIWMESGYEPVRVAVNLSGQQIRGPALVNTVRDALAENDLSPHLLELELTESTIMRDDEVTSSTLRALSEMGVALVLDDFGTGYSSLTHLRRYPIDSLKIDRSFVAELPDNEEDVAITTALIAMAHGLRTRVTAEGIETEAQLAFLREHGCDVAQGFLFSRPIPGPDFPRFLAPVKTDAP